MPNKTIYVSENDSALFKDAKTLAGGALSSVIVRALREYVSMHQKMAHGMKEISVKVGSHNAQREQRFIGEEVGKWSGLSDDKVWLMNAKIYQTQKGNWAILLQTSSKSTLLTNPNEWEKNAEYLEDEAKTELIVKKNLDGLKEKLPTSLYATIEDISKKYEVPVEYLDI